MNFIKILYSQTLISLLSILTSFLVLVLGSIIDRLTRSAIGHKLIEDSFGGAFYYSLLVFGLFSILLSLKLTSGIAKPSQYDWHLQLPFFKYRIFLFFIIAFLGSVVSGISTKNLKDNWTDPTGASLLFVPIYYAIDTWYLIRHGKLLYKLDWFTVLLRHFEQGLIRILFWSFIIIILLRVNFACE